MRRRFSIPLFVELLIVGILMLAATQQPLYAQQTEKRTIRCSEMWNIFENLDGGGWETTWCWPGGRIREKLPGEFRIMNGCCRKFGASLGVRNWTNQKGQFKSYYIAGPGSNSITRNCGDASGLPGRIKVILRRPPPRIIVDDSEDLQQQTYDEIDPTIISDVLVESEYHYAVGLSQKRRIYIYTPNNDKSNSYIYYDYIWTNTGKVRPEPDSIAFPGQTLHDVGLVWGAWPHVAFEGATEYGRIWENTNDDWVEYYGENYKEYLGSGTPAHPAGNPRADSLRLWIIWDGTPPPPAIDDVGDPDKNVGFTQQSPGQGKFLSHQYAGFGILWADKSVTDRTNDLSQPFTTTWTAGSKGPLPFLMDQWYKFLFSGEHKLSPQEMGFKDPTDPGTVAAPFPYASVGLYEMPFGSSVHVAVAAAVGGVSQEVCIKYGRLWWQRQHGGPGITDAEKDSIIATGRDSLLLTYSLATRRFFRNIEDFKRNPYDAPDAPPAPDLKITSAQRSVKLEWSDVSQEPDFDTGVKDFAGYRVYRRQIAEDSLWQMIWDSRVAGRPFATSYIDSSVQRGLGYQYYVTAYDDGSQNWRDPGVSLESGKFWNMTPETRPVHPYLGAEVTLNKVRVYPNPFNTKSAPLNFPGEPNKLMFAGLPGKCTIKIFTMAGDLVKTIEHTTGTSQESWDQVTDYNQLVMTGVYIYVIESEIGKTYGKFVIVR